ncbi:MAG: tRNA (cytidine(34)-2'-O)-methyltransferase [Eubacteriales bacterium]|nr:tRNA (cytidine(34)-2'-O)-methyltransferase [Eubacteriales bacterium]
MKIVLHEPGIPLNTGNIGRTCAATNTELHLIGPYGFVITEKAIKRAGMDYWDKIDLHEYIDYEDFLEKHPYLFSENADGAGSEKGSEGKPRLWFATTKARQTYTDANFGPDDFIMLGNESRGIPEEILVRHPESCIRIPMWGDIRSLNLANSAAIILYEALRQNGFENMEKRGNLHRLSWDDGQIIPAGPENKL